MAPHSFSVSQPLLHISMTVIPYNPPDFFNTQNTTFSAMDNSMAICTNRKQVCSRIYDYFFIYRTQWFIVMNLYVTNGGSLS